MAASTPRTPSRASLPAMSDPRFNIGDTVNVPGGMEGTVRYIGEVKGREGIYVGVELSKKWASRGKNDGDVDGKDYFTPIIPNSGIFLPIARAMKREAARPPRLSTAPTAPINPTLSTAYLDTLDEHGGRSHLKTPRGAGALLELESPSRRAATPGARPSLNALSHNRSTGPRSSLSPMASKFGGKLPAAKINQDDELVRLHAIIQAQTATIKEKNATIAKLVAEFDDHRADFRRTLDTLETASSETERMYEKKLDELTKERSALLAQSEDVAVVAEQLKEVEEVVQELEEGLEDARRGEAEARGEVEYLRGELERERAVASIAQPASADKWCALCEQDGHDSISCPNEKH